MDSPFITDQQLQAFLASRLRVDVTTMPTAWLSGVDDTGTGVGIVHDSNMAAFLFIRGELLGRGFGDAQILAWDRGFDYNRDIGLFWCLVNGAAYVSGFNMETVKFLDRRQELRMSLVEVNGTPQNMAGTPEQIGHGRMDNRREDRRAERIIVGDPRLTEEPPGWM